MGYHSVCISVVVSIIFGCFTKSTFAQCNTIQENATVICAGVKSCAIESFLAAGNFANGLCDYTIIDYACSSVEHFVGKDLANLLNCTVNNNVKFTKEALKLFFTRVSGVLDSALDAYSNATTSPSLSKALILDVLGELRVNSFSPENLTDMDFIKQWFLVRFKPFLASASVDFLSCLSTKNFSCETYQAVVTELNNEFSNMDNKGQQWVYTYFINPFLSSSNASGSTCISSTSNSRQWLQKNYGHFVVFAKYKDFVNLNSNFSGVEALALLSPGQVAELTVDPSVGALDNVVIINQVFDMLQNHSHGRELEDFFTMFVLVTAQRNITAIYNTDVRMVMLNRTFAALSPEFPTFSTTEWEDWFQVKLVLLLPSVSPGILAAIPNNISCDSYQAIIKGLDHALKSSEQSHLNSSLLLPPPKGCPGHLEKLDLLSPEEISSLILDPKVGALESVGIINQIFDRLQNDSNARELDLFFIHFVYLTQKDNVTVIKNTDVRMVMLNRTFAALSPAFPTFSTTEWEDWFQVKLVLLLPSVNPGILAAIPNNISCDSYQAIIKGLDHALKSSEQSHLNSSLLLPPPKGCPGHLEKLDLLSPEEISSLILDPKVGALESVGIINQIFDRLQNDSNARELDLFFIHFVYLTQKDNVTVIKNTDVRMVMLNRTFATLSPAFPTFSTTEWEDWFQVKLVLLLPSVSPGILAAIPNNISCDSYQAIMKGLDSVFRALSPEQSQMVFNFSKNFLLQQSPGGFPCVNSTISTKGWLERNLQRFSSIASYRDLRLLNRNFAMLEDLDVLTLLQFSQLAAAPGILNTSEDVRKLMIFLNSSNSALFFDVFIPAVQGRDVPNAVKTALIQGALDKGNLSAANDAEILRWLDIRLMPLLPGLTPNQVLLLFAPLKKMNCSTNHEAVKILSSISVTLNEIVQKEVYNTILTTLKDPTPLRCYTNNSFLVYMNDTFLNFGSFLTLTSILSVAPETRAAELVNTVTPTELSQFLSVPERIDSLTLLTEVLKNYTQLPLFIDDFNGRISQVNMSKAIKSSILRAVWTTVLSTDSEADLDKWFSTRLIPYLEAFDKNLITSSDTLAAKCLPFRKLVQVLGNSSSYYTDFDRKDVYGTIKSYLSTGTKPKCYNAADPVLNSTAWFANYLGPFIIFSSQNDINIFGSTEQLKIFADNSDNLKLMSNELIPQDVRALYSSLVFHQNPAFSITELPGALLCFAPDSGYSSVKPAELQALSERLLKACNKTLDSAIVSNVAPNIQNASADIIKALGIQSDQLSQGQIGQIQPGVVIETLNILNTVSWNQGQAILLVTKVFQNGYKLDNVSSLTSLGTLVQGLPSNTIASVSPAVALSAANDPAFVQNIIRGPEVLQQIFINKIITVNSDPNVMLQNIPDDMAGLIPLPLLTFLGSTFNLEQIEKKKWKKEQASLFFHKVAITTTSYDNLSPYILQGFSCSAVQSIPNNNTVNIVKACRGKKVPLVEDQLSCMAYHVAANASPQDFTSYPVDMLLYYPYSQIPSSNCRSYFTEIGGANFYVFSETSNRPTALTNSAKNCLGITGTSLSSADLNVLNNMVCILNGSYIENSDNLILEKLKKCEQLTAGQIASVQKVLFSGTTKYGNSSTWTQKTLADLEELPLFLTSEFWSKFKQDDRKSFLKAHNNVKKGLKKELFTQLGLARRVRRAAACTAGEITTAKINEVTFPIDYDETQFSLCLANSTVKDNLALLTEKVLVENYQTVLLQKLKEAYNNSIPEDQLQLLGATSRVASVADINSWTITTADTLSALMKSEDGRWDADKSAAIITKYLAAGKTLDAVALKAIGGENLCSLSLSQLKNITAPNLRDAGALDISSCTPEKKKKLYNTASAALINQRSDVLTYYSLIKPYLGGAPLEDVLSIAQQNINMDITTFKNLDKDLILKLSPDTVKNLLGNNLRDLESQVNDPVIKEWLSRQAQSTLNSLGVSGVTGIPDPLPVGVITILKPEAAGANQLVPRVLQTLFIGMLTAALQKVL
ncbi:uncharacterized protein LOC121330804 isoform X4 [Polyodon spathula]|uniref:uncharacterized protein LOC121330804 isoform X4 n=1 Tax=Polyodon spathula TaxID=7913 RepID=UPI001B7F27BB|nr:uncharacterized protein LOC121330804 isoform X4 [Polyodon spathula]